MFIWSLWSVEHQGTSVQKPDFAQRTQLITFVQSAFVLHGGPCLPVTHTPAGGGPGGDGGGGGPGGPGGPGGWKPEMVMVVPVHVSSLMTDAGHAICSAGRWEALSTVQHVATALRKLPPPQLSETLLGPPYAAWIAALDTGALPTFSEMTEGVPSFCSCSRAASK